MITQSFTSIYKQRGQAILLGMFMLMTAAISTVLLYNIGQSNNHKTTLVNAADASAYSGAIYIARNLNFMAYTNRAMIANHVAVGHFVSYVSWIRYVENTTKKLRNGLALVPYVSQALASAKKLVTLVKKGTEAFAPVLVNSLDTFNKLLNGAQTKGRHAVTGVLSVSDFLSVKIMDKVGKSYDPAIRINYKSDLGKKLAIGVTAQVASDFYSALRYFKSYSPAKDSGRMKKMIESSYAGSRQWIKGNRGWKLGLVFIKVEKKGKTKHRRKLDWRADDKLTLSVKKGFKWKGKTLGKGKARVTQFDSDYIGIHGYYDLSRRGRRAKQSLKVSAYATMPVNSLHLLSTGTTSKDVERIAALSRAEIFYQRPSHGFKKIKRGEYANLYNPFWQVRLIENQL